MKIYTIVMDEQQVAVIQAALTQYIAVSPNEPLDEYKQPVAETMLEMIPTLEDGSISNGWAF